tara:strand:- start:58 stop:870 length:813 start_codon:yes stop_codon:yes gene_type:complete
MKTNPTYKTHYTAPSEDGCLETGDSNTESHKQDQNKGGSVSSLKLDLIYKIVQEATLTPYERTFFITMTFDDDHLHDKESFNDIFLDFVAEASKAGYRLFGAFELGDETARPHFHCVVHDYSDYPNCQQGLQKIWPHGHIDVKQIFGYDSPTFHYVSKYATKTQETFNSLSPDMHWATQGTLNTPYKRLHKLKNYYHSMSYGTKLIRTLLRKHVNLWSFQEKSNERALTYGQLSYEALKYFQDASKVRMGGTTLCPSFRLIRNIAKGFRV